MQLIGSMNKLQQSSSELVLETLQDEQHVSGHVSGTFLPIPTHVEVPVDRVSVQEALQPRRPRRSLCGFAAAHAQC